MNWFRRILTLALAALPMFAAAQAWPSKPIKLILPFPAGGQTDAVVRYYAQKAEVTLGQSIVVENKPGVNSVIGTQEVARAPSDGYTLLFNMTAIVSNPVLIPASVKYDALQDFAPIQRTYELYAVLAVPASSPYKTLAEFVAAAKASPQPFTYGTTGHASSSHYFVEMLAKQAGLTMVHVPYKGEAPLLPDLISGRCRPASCPARRSSSSPAPTACGRSRSAATSGWRCCPTCRPSRSWATRASATNPSPASLRPPARPRRSSTS